MERPADGAAMVATLVVAAVALSGGAFYPHQRLVAGVALALACAWVAACGWERCRPDEVAVMAWLGWGVLVAAWMQTAPLAAKETLTGWLVTLLLWVAVRRAGRRTREAALGVLSGTGCLLAVGIVLEYAGFGAPRVGGLLENPNNAAALLVPTMAAAFTMRHRVPRSLLGAVLALDAVAVVLTSSRAGLVAGAAAAVVMLPRWRHRLVAGACGAATVLAAAAWRFGELADPLAWQRSRIWMALLSLVKDHPVTGVSPGGLADWAGQVRLLHPYQEIVQHPYLATYSESTVLAVLVQTGVVGAVLATVALVLWLRLARSGSGWSDGAFRGAVVAMACMAVVHDLSQVEVVLWWWAVLLGAVMPLHCDETEGLRPPVGRVLVGLGVTAVVLWGMVQPAAARLLWRSRGPDAAVMARVARMEPWFDAPLAWRVASLLARPEWTWDRAAEALECSRSALRVHPGSAQLWALQARVHQRTGMELGARSSFAEARRCWSRASELDPNVPWHWIAWSQLERADGQLERARSLVQQAVGAEPYCVRGWLLLARLELDMGREEAARRALARARQAQERGGAMLLRSDERAMIDAPQWQFEELEEKLRNRGSQGRAP